MEIVVDTSALRAMLAHAAVDTPREACGLLWCDPAHGRSTLSTIDRAEPAANVAAQPMTSFEIDPAALFGAQRRERAGGGCLAGWYHSHPSGVLDPSPSDAEAAGREPGRVWIIVGAARAAAWRSRPGGPVLGAFEALKLRIG